MVLGLGAAAWNMGAEPEGMLAGLMVGSLALGVAGNRFTRVALWAANGWRTGPQPEREEETLLTRVARPRPGSHPLLLGVTGTDRPFSELVATAKACWRVGRTTRELKEELGLDHFEGRSWQGWCQHAAPVTAACVFLREEQRRRGRRA